MKHARIYCQSRHTGQSGLATTGQWVLEIERPSAQSPEPLMGWTQSGDTVNQIKMEFSSPDEAEAFAKDQGWRYTISRQNERRVKPRNYGDNFICDMVE